MDIKNYNNWKRIFMQIKFYLWLRKKTFKLLIIYFWTLRWLAVIVYLLQLGLVLLHRPNLKLTSSSTALPFYFPFNSCAWRRPFKPSCWPPNLILDLSDVPYAHDYCYYQSILQRQNHLPELPMPFLILFLFVLWFLVFPFSTLYFLSVI